MKYCKLCVTPDTRPRIEFDEEGVCNACRYAEQKAKTDWDAKLEELKDIAKDFKNPSGYDCIVAVSGGKDSHYQAWFVKNVLKLNPLCVTFAPAMPNEIGQKNLRNLITKIGVDHLYITPNPDYHKKLSRAMFLEHGNCFLPWTQGVYAAVARVAVEKKIPLIIYGENGEEEYGGTTKSKKLDKPGVKLRVKSNRPDWTNPRKWDRYGVPKSALVPYIEPSQREFDEVGLKRIFLGDYINWQTNKHLYYAMNVIGGFEILDEPTNCTYTRGATMDDDIDEVYIWFLWVKYGLARANKSASPDIREGMLSREDAIEMIKRLDVQFPSEALGKVLEYMDVSVDEFWDTVEKFIGKEAWKKVGDRVWKHRNTIHGEERYLRIPKKCCDGKG